MPKTAEQIIEEVKTKVKALYEHGNAAAYADYLEELGEEIAPNMGTDKDDYP